MADDQQLWGYEEVAAYLSSSIGAVRSRKSRGSMPPPDDTSVPDRPRWRPSTIHAFKPLGRGFRSDLHTSAQHSSPS